MEGNGKFQLEVCENISVIFEFMDLRVRNPVPWGWRAVNLATTQWLSGSVLEKPGHGSARVDVLSLKIIGWNSQTIDSCLLSVVIASRGQN